MAIIGKPTAHPVRIVQLINFLEKDPNKYTKNQLKALFTPTKDENSRGIFDEVFSVADLLGLITKTDAKQGSPKVSCCLPDKNQTILEIIEAKIFSPTFQTNDTFATALAWFLMQNPKNPRPWETSSHLDVSNDFNNKYGELDLTSPARNQHFYYWSEYLGFSQRYQIGGKTYQVPDPTNAIKRYLKLMDFDGKEVPIITFIETLSRRLPVLEFGSVRSNLEQSARERLKREPNILSASTSLALLRLENQKLISLEDQSDAKSMQLDGVKSRRITHIHIEGGVK